MPDMFGNDISNYDWGEVPLMEVAIVQALDEIVKLRTQLAECQHQRDAAVEALGALLDFYEQVVPDEIKTVGSAVEFIRTKADEKKARHANGHKALALCDE